MLNKYHEAIWNNEAKCYFEKTKQPLTHDPMLINPYYSKEFLAFSFSLEDAIVDVLLQRNSKRYEQPIFFFDRDLMDVEMKYGIMEK